MKRKLYDLKNQRAAHLKAAQDALTAGNQETYTSEMSAATNMNQEIQDMENLISEQERFAAPAAQTPAQQNETAESRAETLRNHSAVMFSTDEVLAAFGVRRPENSTTLATGSLVEPTRAGTLIRDRLSPVSSVIDQVSVIDLTGSAGILEPYVKSEQAAQAGTIAAMAGTGRSATDPVFRRAKISPYEVNVTSYVDRNISNLSPVSYMAKIQSMAMQALRRKVASLIYSGDGQDTPDMFGLKTAKNTDGEALFAILSATAGTVDADTLMNLYFAYGGDDELGGSAGLYLNKADLKAIGELRGTNEKRRLFDITPNDGNPNTGVIKDGGYIIPYTLSSGLTSLKNSVATTSAIQTMLFGNPLAYELALFGNFSIRVDESYKAGERLLTILGDVMVGGNLVVDKSFVIATVPATGG
ncbi:hypothetical protein SDC9_88883 [bioreactor metagenome]|uniref:Phage capsid-like C-terminal domain-containing protein n=1 Tax=bioreactor metagenome TaxID=1076179 RepID=A0A644ZMR5_9ZZZZ